MNIKKMLITTNNKGKAGGNTPKYIVIHDTGNTAATANALNHYKWLQGANDIGSSAHLFIDSNEAIQIIDFNTPAWHTGKLYVAQPQVPECTNMNSIGIEFCINAGSDLEKTLINTADVIAQLMTTYHIDIDHVITHQMSAGKQCPGTFVKNPALFQQLKKNIQAAQIADQQIEEALNYLKAQGVTNSPAYWLEQTKKIEHLTGLILNMYHVLKAAQDKTS